MHGFEWLRDLRALGGEEARQQARWLTESWIYYHQKWSPHAWRADMCGSRIAMWISYFEFFVEVAGPEDLFDSLSKQARHLSRVLQRDVAGVPMLRAIKGLLYAGLACEGRERGRSRLSARRAQHGNFKTNTARWCACVARAGTAFAGAANPVRHSHGAAVRRCLKPCSMRLIY